LATGTGQPAGSAIYFAVDFDPNADQVRGPISDYFRAVSQAFAAAPTRYAVGIYGSGLACRLIRDADLATFHLAFGVYWISGIRDVSSTGAPPSGSPERKIAMANWRSMTNIAQSENSGAFQIAT